MSITLIALTNANTFWIWFQCSSGYERIFKVFHCIVYNGLLINHYYPDSFDQFLNIVYLTLYPYTDCCLLFWKLITWYHNWTIGNKLASVLIKVPLYPSLMSYEKNLYEIFYFQVGPWYATVRHHHGNSELTNKGKRTEDKYDHSSYSGKLFFLSFFLFFPLPNNNKNDWWVNLIYQSRYYERGKKRDLYGSNYAFV